MKFLSVFGVLLLCALSSAEPIPENQTPSPYDNITDKYLADVAREMVTHFNVNLRDFCRPRSVEFDFQKEIDDLEADIRELNKNKTAMSRISTEINAALHFDSSEHFTSWKYYCDFSLFDDKSNSTYSIDHEICLVNMIIRDKNSLLRQKKLELAAIKRETELIETMTKMYHLS